MGRLDDLAAAALKKHNGNVEKATPDFVRAVTTQKLINELAQVFLRQVAGSGHAPPETQSQGARPTPPPKGSIKVREYDVPQHRRRTHEEKEADRAAMMASVEAVFELQIEGRALGNIRIGELASLKHHLVDEATNKLMMGAEQVRNAVIAELIEAHVGIVPDQLTRVRDNVTANTAMQIVAQAEQEAPRRISQAMQQAAAAIGRHADKEIAA